MCRILAIKSDTEADYRENLEEFAQKCRNSKEYQGHGWGMQYHTPQGWQTYHSINPIWEDEFHQVPKFDIGYIHARSAFEDTGIEISNNMPFKHQSMTFIFNGELRGVKIREEGTIGAEKLFNYLQRFSTDLDVKKIKRGISVVEKKTNYIRAMNFVLGKENKMLVCNYYNEDSDYFTLHTLEEKDQLLISSIPLERSIECAGNWEPMQNREVKLL